MHGFNVLLCWGGDIFLPAILMYLGIGERCGIMVPPFLPCRSTRLSVGVSRSSLYGTERLETTFCFLAWKGTLLKGLAQARMGGGEETGGFSGFVALSVEMYEATITAAALVGGHLLPRTR